MRSAALHEKKPTSTFTTWGEISEQPFWKQCVFYPPMRIQTRIAPFLPKEIREGARKEQLIRAGRIIRAFRESRSWRQEDMVRAINDTDHEGLKISNATLSRVEAGFETKATFVLWSLLRQHFGVDFRPCFCDPEFNHLAVMKVVVQRMATERLGQMHGAAKQGTKVPFDDHQLCLIDRLVKSLTVSLDDVTTKHAWEEWLLKNQASADHRLRAVGWQGINDRHRVPVATSRWQAHLAIQLGQAARLDRNPTPARRGVNGPKFEKRSRGRDCDLGPGKLETDPPSNVERAACPDGDHACISPEPLCRDDRLSRSHG